jgi:hypothetical protein
VKILLDTNTRDRLDEDSSLYHAFKLHKRRDTREIQQIQETDGTTHTTFRNIAATFVKYLAKKFGPLEVDPQASTTILQHIRPTDPQKFAAHLEKPITTEEVITASRAGARRKTPVIDVSCLEFYITNWKSIQAELMHILNDMFLNRHITVNQKQGTICLPKSHPSTTPDTYRPISLLNTEYKLLTRIMAHRLKPILAEQLSTDQYCGIP